MDKLENWVVGFSLTFLLNFVGFYFFLYDVLGARFDNVNLLASQYGGYTAPLFLFEIALLFGLVYIDKKGSRQSYKVHRLLLGLLPLVALVGHYLIVSNALEVVRLISKS